MTRNVRQALTWMGALLLVVAGLITLVVGLFTPVSFGWFAYQPLAGVTLTTATGVFVSYVTVIGSAILAVGLLVLAFLAGWAAKRSRRP